MLSQSLSKCMSSESEELDESCDESNSAALAGTFTLRTGLRTLSFHHNLIAGSASNCFIDISAVLIRRSSSVSFDNEDLLFPFIFLHLKKKTRSTFPLLAGKENKSSTRDKIFDHSDAAGS